MAHFDLRNSLAPGLAALSLTLTCSATAAPSQTGADFTCRGVAAQTCHFAVISEGGGRTDFALAAGATRHLATVAVGADRYMVSVNFTPPENPSACSRTPTAGKRSAWCKLSAVTAQGND